MTHVANMKIVVLWSHEIIKAAQMLEKLTIKDPKPTGQDVDNAIRACYAAIYSPELASGKCPVTIMSAIKPEQTP